MRIGPAAPILPVVACSDQHIGGATGDEAIVLATKLARELVAAAEQPVLGVGTPGVVDADGVSPRTWAGTAYPSSSGCPGHRDTATDSHVGMPVLPLGLDALRERDLVRRGRERDRSSDAPRARG